YESSVVFFFQAEDGIRDRNVTGVQTCALPILTSIPGVTTRTVGTKVPVAAVSGQVNSNDREHWQQISPMPIAWGTPDQEVVNIARKSIPQEEWQILERARKRLTDVKATKFDLLVL